MCLSSGSTLALGGGLRRALCCCWQPKHTTELHQSFVLLLSQMPVQSCSPFLLSAEAVPGPRRTDRQCRTGCAGQLCSASPAQLRPCHRLLLPAPSCLCNGLLPVIPKGVFPKFHPTKGDFRLDRVRIQTCCSQSLIFLLYQRTDLLHTGCDTSIDH